MERGIKSMTNLNEVILNGNLTRDLGADERSFGYTNGGTARANISLAVNRSVKKGNGWVDEVSYFDIVIWGKTAENLKPYLKKGTNITIKGSLKQERWEKDGQKNSRVTINAEQVWLHGGKKDSAPSQETTNESDGGFPEDVPFC